jgi:hypothetical protein
LEWNVTFESQGLLAPDPWSVDLNGTQQTSTSPSLVFAEPNGTYAYTVGSVRGYSASPSSATVTVNGTNEVLGVTFTQLVYPVRFSETGLPDGTLWTVKLGADMHDSTTTSIGFFEPNGSYTYSISAANATYAAPGGSLGVAGAVVSERVAFSLVTYEVAFVESGLAAGLDWSVGLYASEQTSNSTSVSFAEPNGTYSFLVSRVPGYSGAPSSGTISVEGGNVTRAIAFAALPPATYAVSFTETGLPSGTTWSVTFDGTTKNGTSDLSFPGIANGTYGFTVGSLVNPGFGGYVPTPSAGSLSVKGQPASESIVFTLASSGPPSSGSTFLGLPASEGYAVLGGVIVALAALAVFARLRSRRGKAPPAPAERIADPPASP